MAYILPQVRVFQQFSQAPQQVQLQNPFVFGPHYGVKRDQQIGAYVPGSDTDYSYPLQPSSSVVDVNFFFLYLTDVLAEYAVIPESTTSPVVVTSELSRNKLRATPHINTPELLDTTEGVGLDDGGFYTGGISLPENYYLTPYGGWTGSAWSASGYYADLGNSQDAKMNYVTTEGYAGVIDLAASLTPLAADVTVQGPDGVVLDFDAGTRKKGTISYTAGYYVADDEVDVGAITFVFKAVPAAPYEVLVGANSRESMDNLKQAIYAAIATAAITDVSEVMHVYGVSTDVGTLTLVGGSGFTTFNDKGGAVTLTAFSALRSPVVLSIESSAGSKFTVTVNPLKIGDAIDSSISGANLNASFEISGSALSVAFTPSTLSLVVNINTASTLDEVYDELVGDSDVATWFSISEISGTASQVVTVVKSQDASPAGEAFPYTIIPDAYRIFVQANEYVFATGNGYDNSYQFKTRGVQVGDRVAWEFMDESSVIHSGVSKVTGFEADYTRAIVADPSMKSTNVATQTASSLSFKTPLAVLTPGDDNQRDFNGSGSGLFSLDSGKQAYPGDYTNGIVDENIVVTITAGGAIGTARASVESVYGTYNRTNVQIVSLPSFSATQAAIYIGNNLWLKFVKTGGDADAVFQVGDTYTLSTVVETGFTTIGASLVSSAGEYVGTKDTTYMLEVTRGGVFNRAVNAIDGLSNASRAVVTSITTGNFTIDGVVVAYTNASTLVSGINAAASAAFAEVDGSDVNVYASYTVINGISATGCTVTKELAELVPSVDFANVWAQDVDDEYVLRCTKAGVLTTAEFSLESQRGDIQTLVKFMGTGSINAVTLGVQGVEAYFNITGAVTFTVGDYWVIKVNGSRPQVRISDTMGSDQGSSVTIDNDIEFSLGLNGAKFTFLTNTNNAGGFVSGGGLVKGDVFYVACTASAAGPLKVLVLADDMPVEAVPGQVVDAGTGELVASMTPSRFAMRLRLLQLRTEISKKRLQSPPDYNWTTALADFTVYSGIEVQDASWVNVDGSLPYIPVISADIEITYRALLSDYADGVYSIDDIGNVVAELGEITSDNPLAMAVYMALLNCGDKSVFFMGVPTNDLAGYTSVLERAELNDTVYAFAPATQDTMVLAAVKAHIISMSSPDEKKWRIGFVGTALPTINGIYTKETNPTGVDYVGTVTADPANPTQYTILTVTNGSPTFIADVKVGDKVRIDFSTDAWGDATYSEYTVASVLTNATLKLSTSLASPIVVPIKSEIWHPYSVAEMATAVAATSAGFASSRVYHVFPSVGYNGHTMISSEYIAAGAAALATSVLPQQGLTNIEFNGLTDLPMVYRTFTKDQLNQMAESGTMILMQTAPGGRVYVRHQVSTASLDGNLNTTELSMVKNLDSISYFYADLLSPFIGIFNVTPQLINQLETEINKGLRYLGSYTGTGLLGPQVILDNDNSKIVSIAQHATLKDHVICVLNVELPAPFNVIELHIVV